MSQGRDPPAYLEYASSMLASRTLKLMTAEEVGVFYLMRLECWVNGSVPSTSHELSRILGFDCITVQSALPAVMPFFVIEEDELRCPELDKYRQHLEARKTAQSEAGKRTQAILADKKQKNKRSPKRSARSAQSEAAKLTGNQPTEMSASVQLLNTTQPNTTQPKAVVEEKEEASIARVALREVGESARAYSAATRGD